MSLQQESCDNLLLAPGGHPLVPPLLLSPRDIDDLSSISGQDDDEKGDTDWEQEGRAECDDMMEDKADDEKAGLEGPGVAPTTSVASPRCQSPLARGVSSGAPSCRRALAAPAFERSNEVLLQLCPTREYD